MLAWRNGWLRRSSFWGLISAAAFITVYGGSTVWPLDLSEGSSHVLLAGLLLAGVVRLAAQSLDERRINFCLNGLILMGAVVCLLPWDPEQTFRFRSYARYSGIFDNPNYYGLYCGLVLVGLISKLIQRWSRPQRDCRQAAYLVTVGAAMLLLLLRTYSRGAWLATTVALLCLVWPRSESEGTRLWSWLKSQRGSTTVVVALIVLVGVCFLPYGFAERALSIFNLNDFSWRNRLSSWFGGLNIMADFPGGVGWTQVDVVYHHFYAPDNLLDTVAIDRNSFVVCGVAAGMTLPALLLGLIGRVVIVAPGARVAKALMLLFAVSFAFDSGLLAWEVALPFWVVVALADREADFARGPGAAPFYGSGSNRFTFGRNPGAALALLTVLALIATARISDPYTRRWVRVQDDNGEGILLFMTTKNRLPCGAALLAKDKTPSLSVGADLRAVARSGCWAVSLVSGDLSVAKQWRAARNAAPCDTAKPGALILEGSCFHGLDAFRELPFDERPKLYLLLAGAAGRKAAQSERVRRRVKDDGASCVMLHAILDEEGHQGGEVVRPIATSPSGINLIEVVNQGVDFGYVRSILIRAVLEHFNGERRR